MFGFMRTPLVAMVLMLFNIWSGVTDIPCPNGTVALAYSSHTRRPLSDPLRSNGKSIPVFLPNPKASTYDEIESCPNFSAVLVIPMLLDFWIISLKLSQPFGRTSFMTCPFGN